MIIIIIKIINFGIIIHFYMLSVVQNEKIILFFQITKCLVTKLKLQL